jgi:hypothetical protein
MGRTPRASFGQFQRVRHRHGDVTWVHQRMRSIWMSGAPDWRLCDLLLLPGAVTEEMWVRERLAVKVRRRWMPDGFPEIVDGAWAVTDQAFLDELEAHLIDPHGADVEWARKRPRGWEYAAH